MIDHLWTFLSEQLASNQFLAGGAVLGIIAGIVHQCKAIPARIWRWIKAQVIITVDVPDRDEAFLWVNAWLASQPYGKKHARLLTVATQRPDTDGYVEPGVTKLTQPEILFSPAAGAHWFWYKRRLVKLFRERKDGSEGGKGDSDVAKAFGIRETFYINVFGRNRKIAQDILEEARELAYPKGEHRIALLSPEGYHVAWRAKSNRRPRPIESIILKNGVWESLIEQVGTFLKSEMWYVERGIPWRLGLLFKGCPGSGKSSAVIGLASHFGLDIAVLDLAGSNLDDNALRQLLSDVPKNTLVLLEDVDCVFEKREATKHKENKVTFSGLLNAIDGVSAGEGRILIMTTNHPEKLDAALIRAGRADVHVVIDAPDRSQVVRIYERFFPEADAMQTRRFVEAVNLEATSMACLQNLLMENRNDAEAAIANAPNAVIRIEQPISQGVAV